MKIRNLQPINSTAPVSQRFEQTIRMTIPDSFHSRVSTQVLQPGLRDKSPYNKSTIF